MSPETASPALRSTPNFFTPSSGTRTSISFTGTCGRNDCDAVQFQLLARNNFDGGRNRFDSQPEARLQNAVEQLAFFSYDRIGRKRGNATAQREQCRHAGGGVFGSELGNRFVGETGDFSAAGDARPSQVNAVHQAGAGRAVKQGEAGVKLPLPPHRRRRRAAAETADPWVLCCALVRAAMACTVSPVAGSVCRRRWRGRCRRPGRCGSAATARGPRRFVRDRPWGRRRV